MDKNDWIIFKCSISTLSKTPIKPSGDRIIKTKMYCEKLSNRKLKVADFKFDIDFWEKFNQADIIENLMKVIENYRNRSKSMTLTFLQQLTGYLLV